MRRTTGGVLLFLGAVLAVGPAFAGPHPGEGEGVSLRLRLREGQVLWFKLTRSDDLTMKSELLSKIQCRGTEVITFRFEVKAVDPDTGAMTIAVTYERVEAAVKSDDLREWQYDSADGGAEVALSAQAVAAVIGEGFEMEISDLGRLHELRGVDRLLRNAGKKIGSGPATEIPMDALKRHFGREATGAMIEDILAIRPEEPVAVGDRWRVSLTERGPYPCELEREFRLKGRKDGIATLGVKTKISPNPMTEGDEDSETTVFVKGNSSGTIELDEATGWIQRAKRKIKLSVERKIEIPAMKAGDHEVKMEVEPIKMTVKGTETIEPVDD